MPVPPERNAPGEAEEALRYIAANARCVLWQADVEDRGELYCHWTAHLADIEAAQRFLPLDVPAGSTYLSAWYRSVLPDDQKRRDRIANEAVRAGRGYRFAYRCRARDGTLRWLQEDVQVETLAPGRWRAAGLCTDITDRKLTEAALRESEARYRALIEQAADGIWLTDIEGRVLEVNDSACRMLGYKLEELLSLTATDLFHPEDLARRPQELAMERAHYAILTERRMRRKDGTYVLVEGSGRFVAPGRILTVTRDISERRRVEDALRESEERFRQIASDQRGSLERLAEADRQKDEFLAMLAHELRNPLAPILNAARIIELQKGPGAEPDRHLKAIIRQARHMARLLDDLLDVSRITRGKIELRLEPVDLRAVVDQALENCRPVIEHRGHTLEVRIEDAPILLHADEARLLQIIDNLVNNAAKYTEPGGRIDLAVELVDGQAEPSTINHQPSTPAQPPTALISVRDTGMGIPPELLPNIFDLFTQGDRSLARSEGGLGIGLTMVRRLVELHGGTVSAHSEGRDQGSEFVVRLPVLKEEGGRIKDKGIPDAEHRAPNARLHPSSFILPPSKRVLVVEDSPDAAESMQDLLDFWGYQVRLAASGAEGLRVAREFRPEVVLLDLGLPGMDGFEVARRLRSEPDLAGVHLVAITGYGQEEDRRRSREAGMDRHLTKPVDPDTLRTLLDQLLRA